MTSPDYRDVVLNPNRHDPTISQEALDSALASDVCWLCGQIQGIPEADLLHRLLPGGASYQRRVVFELDGFAAVPSLGPLISGHVLLVPSRHVRSFSALTAAEQRVASSAASQVEHLLEREYGVSVQAFEHGNAREGDRIACSVEHAHLHLLPIEVDASPWIDDDLDWFEWDGRGDLSDVVGAREYLRIFRARLCLEGGRHRSGTDPFAIDATRVLSGAQAADQLELALRSRPARRRSHLASPQEL